VLALGFISSAYADSINAVDVDGKNINIPSIDDFFRIDSSSPGLYDYFSTVIPPQTMLVSAYISEDDLQKIENGEQPDFSHIINIIGVLNDGKDTPYYQFEQVVEGTKQKIREMEKHLKEVQAYQSAQDLKLSTDTGILFENIINTIAPYPSFIDNENAYAVTAVVDRENTIDGQFTTFIRATTKLLLFIKDRILNVTFYSNHSKESDAILQEYKVVEWLSKFYATNYSNNEETLPDCPSDVDAFWSNCFGTYTQTWGEYVGEFDEFGYYSGQGIYTFPIGDKYVGEFKRDNFNGQGIYTYSTGEIYVGEWKDSKSHGQGTIFMNRLSNDGEKTTDKYVGEFQNGKRNGQGRYTYADGSIEVGEFKDDMLNGLGVHIFGETTEWAGDIYVGELQNGKRNGHGTYWRSDGTTMEGIWKDDECISGDC
jgi:hypothetical protein